MWGGLGVDISIIVPHLNQPGPLDKALASLFAQDFDMSRCEVIVVDNGSRELPEAIVARYPGARLAISETPGPGPARNRGVQLARAPILAFTDADCIVDRGWASAILARFTADPDLEIIGGDVRILIEGSKPPTVAEAYEMVYAFPQRRYIEKQNFSGAGNLAVRREVFRKVGPFAGIEISEDTDWGHRATRLGHRIVYAPEMVVYHPPRRTLSEIYVKWDRNICHHYRAFAATPAGKVKWFAKALALSVSPLIELPRILGSRRITGAGPRWRAFKALSAIRFYRARQMLAIMIRANRTEIPGVQWNR